LQFPEARNISESPRELKEFSLEFSKRINPQEIFSGIRREAREANSFREYFSGILGELEWWQEFLESWNE
jgi:hypothetical protein